MDNPSTLSFPARIFSIDARSLAFFRIALGITLLVDLTLRAFDLRWHYTDEGILPRELMVKLAERPDGQWHWSLHMFSGTTAMQGFLFALAGAFAFLLMIGWRSRWMAFLSWLLLTSLQMRNPAVNNAGDLLLRMLTFWAMFLPLGSCFAIDAVPRQVKNSARSFVSIATAAILLQFAMMYWCTGASKINPIWLEGDALFRTMSRYAYVRPLGAALLDWPRLLHILSIITPFLEIILPLLCFSPWWTRGFRVIAIIAFFLFHLGVELTLHTGIFPYISMVGWILLIPSSIWDRLARKHDASMQTAESMDKPPPQVMDEVAKPPCCAIYRFAEHGMVALLLLFVIYWNVNITTRMVWQAWHPESHNQVESILPRSIKPIDNALRAFGLVTNLSQRWGMFAQPGTFDGWFVFVGETRDGRKLNLLEGGEFDQETYKRPNHPAGIHANHRWRKFFNQLSGDFDEDALGPSIYREYLPRTIARRWNATSPEEDHIDYLEMIFITSIIETPGNQRTSRVIRFFRGIADPPDAAPTIIIGGQ